MESGKRSTWERTSVPWLVSARSRSRELRSDHFRENEERKTDNGGGAKNCGSHVRVSGAVYRFLPGSESENQKVQDVWPAPSDSGRNLRGTGKGKRYGRKQKSAFFRFFVFRYRHFRGSAIGKKRKKNRFCIRKNHRENA